MLLASFAVSLLIQIPPQIADLTSTLYAKKYQSTEKNPIARSYLIPTKIFVLSAESYIDHRLAKGHSKFKWPFRVAIYGFSGYLTFHNIKVANESKRKINPY